MTMVALLGHPAKSDSLSPHTTVSTQCQFSKDSPATYPAPQQPETHEFYLPAVLRDIPTDVPTTADTDDDDDDDRRRCHPSITVDDFTTTAPTFLQEKDTFYTELLQLAHSLGVSTQTTNEELHDSLAAASTADNDSPTLEDPDSIHAFLSELNALHNELTFRLPQPSTSSPRTPANDADDTHDRNNEYANTDRDDNNDHDKAERSIAAYDKDDHDSNERVNNERDDTDNNDNSTGAVTPRTTENIIEHGPKDSVIATSDPPMVADPEPHHAFQNLAVLQSEMTYVPCSPVAREPNTSDNDGSTQPLTPVPQPWHRRQNAPTSPNARHATPHQPSGPADSVSSTVDKGKVATTKIKSDQQQSPRKSPFTSDPTLEPLWIILKELEEINTQFAQWLDTLPIEKATATPDNTPGNQLNPPNAPNVTMTKMFQPTPTLHHPQTALPPCANHVDHPTGRMFLLLSSSDRHPPTVRTPPWPPPMSQVKFCDKDNKRYHTQFTHLLPTLEPRILLPTQHRRHPTRPAPEFNHVSCHYYFINQHDRKCSHVCFKIPTLCTRPMMFWPKEDMRPP